MFYTRIKNIQVLLLFFFTLASIINLNAQNEKGLLPIKIYKTSDYNGLQQVFDIQTDSRGIVYASNNVGLLELSGSTWKIHKVKGGAAVRSLFINTFGIIFTGGNNEFGYFSSDSTKSGNLTYHSLSDSLKEGFEFGKIQSIVCKNNITYFQSNHNLFIYQGDSIRIIKNNKRYSSLFLISDKVCIPVQDKGYYYVKDSITLAMSISSRDIKCGVAPINDNKYLFFNKQSGLNVLSTSNNKLSYTKKIKTPLNNIGDIKVVSILKISNRFYSVASNKGIFIIDIDGKINRVINRTSGLLSNIVTHQCLDSNNNLWVSTENGIARINIASSNDFFPQKVCDYKGRIEDIKRFDGHIHIITETGLYVLDQASKKSLIPPAIQKFQEFTSINAKKLQEQDLKYISELSGPCWDLELFSLNNENKLLVSTNNYVIAINKGGSIEKVAACYPYTSYQSVFDSNRVYIGLDGGLQSVYYNKGQWINEGTISGINEVIKKIAEDNHGNLWLSTSHQGVLLLQRPIFKNHKLENPQISKLKRGLVDGDPVRSLSIDNKFLFASSYGIYKYSNHDSTFVLDNSFNKSINSTSNIILRLSKDKNNNLWSVVVNDKTKKLGVFYLTRKKGAIYNESKIYANKDELCFSFYHEARPSSIHWYGGTFGLAKINTAKLNDDSVIFYTYITKVLNNTDTAFGGFYATDKGVTLTQPKSYIKTFDYKHNSFTFHFSSSSPKDFDNLEYSWYLEGYEPEPNWVPWTNKTYKEYTNLNEGNYTFHVKSKDIYGNESLVAAYTFSIAPPWYRTIYAYIGILIVFILFVKGAIRISTRGLNRIIKEATLEITKQKDELETKNRNIIDSIRYAQRIQEAVIPSDRAFKKFFKKSFVLWKPRDIVSGDFYWLAAKDNKIYLAAADSTGHGVPGAFMSIMGISFLNQIIGSNNHENAADILNRLRRLVISAINKEKDSVENKDGMDMALCIYDFEKMQIEYAGAYNALYIVRNGELLETKADRMPIGVHSRDKKSFTNKVIDIQKGDKIYIFSDGYLDQFGGPKGKKFMAKRFKRLLLEMEEYSMKKQKYILWQRFTEWRGDIEQIDDIIIIGIMVD